VRTAFHPCPLALVLRYLEVCLLAGKLTTPHDYRFVRYQNFVHNLPIPGAVTHLQLAGGFVL
jgi:hypothetical protein